MSLLVKAVVDFLSKNWDGFTPLLLGYSGGPDSKALLYSLLKAGCRNLEVAHVDHGWREESALELAAIREEISRLGLPFYSTRLKPGSKKNMEATARLERLSYFQLLFQKKSYGALLLGHQADDLAETALKRLLEGAHLPFLGGMEPVSEISNLPIWRPLLKVRRSEILEFLKEEGVSFFSDPTNRDPLFLRSRMREEILPFLNHSFGKEVVDNLAHLSERSYELKQYLDLRVASCRIEKGEWGIAACCANLERIEKRHFLQKVGSLEGLTLPRTVLEPLLDWLEQKKGGKKIFYHSRWILAQSGWVFFLHTDSGKALPEKGWARKLTISFDANHSISNQ